jgi:hypothetical protein
MEYVVVVSYPLRPFLSSGARAPVDFFKDINVGF